MSRYKSHYGLFLGLAVALVIGVVSLCTVPARAAPPKVSPSAATKGGVTISPALQDVTISSADTTASFKFVITNNTDQVQEFKLSVVDFGSLDDTGGLLFVGQGDKRLDYKYGLSSWAKPAQDQVKIAAKTSVTVPIVVTNQSSLLPGGHYGAVLVSSAEAGSGASAKVQVNQIASALLFVKKQGGENYRLSLDTFQVASNLFKLPTRVDLRFHNAGNVHLVPRGIVSVSDARGRLVRRGIINTDSAIVLPEAYRKLSVPLSAADSSGWLPGRYRLSVAYRFDGQDTVQTDAVSILYINPGYLIAVILVLAGLLAVVFRGRLRHVVRRAGAGPGRRFRRRKYRR